MTNIDTTTIATTPVMPATQAVWIVSEGDAYRDCGRIPGGRYGYDWVAIAAVDETDALRQGRAYDDEGTGPDGGARTLRRLRLAVLACGPSDALREVLAPRTRTRAAGYGKR